jgi:hypothetical protein
MERNPTGETVSNARNNPTFKHLANTLMQVLSDRRTRHYGRRRRAALKRKPEVDKCNDPIRYLIGQVQLDLEFRNQARTVFTDAARGLAYRNAA